MACSDVAPLPMPAQLSLAPPLDLSQYTAPGTTAVPRDGTRIQCGTGYHHPGTALADQSGQSLSLPPLPYPQWHDFSLGGKWASSYFFPAGPNPRILHTGTTWCVSTHRGLTLTGLYVEAFLAAQLFPRSCFSSTSILDCPWYHALAGQVSSTSRILPYFDDPVHLYSGVGDTGRHLFFWEGGCFGSWGGEHKIPESLSLQVLSNLISRIPPCQMGPWPPDGFPRLPSK